MWVIAQFSEVVFVFYFSERQELQQQSDEIRKEVRCKCHFCCLHCHSGRTVNCEPVQLHC